MTQSPERRGLAPNDAAHAALFLGAVPADPLFGTQWHLAGGPADINLRDVWAEFTGRGVTVAVIDDGFDLAHADLVANYDPTRDYDWRAADMTPAAEAGDHHGTAVMGVVGAARNATGGVGVAPEATLVGLRVGYGSAGSPLQYADALQNAARFEVVNNSWGYTDFFVDDFNSFWFASSGMALADAARDGRGGLGTVVVFSAGNARASGDNVNHHNYQNNVFTIAVAATDSAGRVAGFSTPGAALLVAAPGVGITTTDVTAGGYVAGDAVTLSGTSFAAPVVAGVVALMLDANAGLGWRDVHEILAYSARRTDLSNPTWMVNAARDANGGGLHTSTDLGFGLVDAHAAVRLAESWTGLASSANLLRAVASAAPNLALADAGLTSASLVIGQDIRVDRAEVTLDLRHGWIGDLRLTLISPGGTRSVLIDRPGVAPGGAGPGSSADNIRFDLTSTQFWGESGLGTWTLEMADLRAGDAGRLVSWRLELLGDAPSPDDRYIYTDGFAALGADPARRLLTDAGGTDTLNAAAVTSASLIDLAQGAVIAGHAVTFAPGTVIENAHGGDAGDRLLGNAAPNDLSGHRGADTLDGRAGDDRLRGGAGDDELIGGDGSDTAVYAGARAGHALDWDGAWLVVADLSGAEGTDRLQGIEWLEFADGTLAVTPPAPEPQGAPATIEVSMSWHVSPEPTSWATLAGSGTRVLTGAEFGLRGVPAGASAEVTQFPDAAGFEMLSAWSDIRAVRVTDADGADVTLSGLRTVLVTLGGTRDNRVELREVKRGSVTTGEGDDTVAIEAFWNDATLTTTGNRFTVATGAGSDMISVLGWGGLTTLDADAGPGDDRITGTDAADRLRGGTGNDVLRGGAGADQFVLRAGDGQDVIEDFDALGVDRLRFEGQTAAAVSWSETAGGLLVRHGGGADTALLLGVTAAQFSAADLLFA